MVVDYRYHAASLVAVFFALGLGVLIGAAIFTEADGAGVPEGWLMALEREMGALRQERRTMAARLDLLAAERDEYHDLVGDLSAAMMRGRLADRRIAVASLGRPDDARIQAMEKALAAAGAVVSRDTSWADVESSEGNGVLPEAVLLFLSGTPGDLGDEAVRKFETMKHAGIDYVLALAPDDQWTGMIEDWDVAYVSHADTALGRLSALLLIESGELGAYGSGELLWPRHLMGP